MGHPGTPTTRKGEGELTGPQYPTVPYVAMWSAERTSFGDIVVARTPSGGLGIAYPDETLTDRDSRGLLWQRVTVGQGKGRPIFGDVHTSRQRRAMRRLLCQVCGAPCDQNEQGILWLLRDERGSWDGWPTGMGTTEPPACTPCVDLATRQCPALRGNHVLIRAQQAPISGAFGWYFRPGPDRPVPVNDGGSIWTPGDPLRHWFLATRLVRELRDVTFL